MEIKVKVRNAIWKVTLMKGGPYIGTATYFPDRIIEINDKSTLANVRSTIIHELTHAFMWEYGFNQVRFSYEVVCDFFGAYGDEIIAAADLVMKKGWGTSNVG